MLRNIALLTVSLLLGVIGAEVAMRVVGVGFPVISKPDPELGFVLRPGLAGWYGKEGGSRILINADGRRDRGFARARSPGTFRVAVLGDSFVLGLEVAEEKGVVASIERELVSCPALSGVAIEALNFGVSGYGTAQEYLMLKSRALGYAPDAVVLAVFAGNDLRNNVRTLQNDPVRPYFVLRENGLHPDDSYRSEVERRTRPSLIRDVTYLMLDHSVLAQSFNELRRSQLPGFGPSRSAGAAVVAEAGVDVEIYAPTAPEPWRQAWSIIEALVAAAAAEVKARDKAFVLATIGAAVETDPDPARR
ncbi:MAG: SGNH/GDSL hydrolase family protein, partial [Alphaproteobacteria bacterium]|nr:SGNH/GDSL hydrolase family protein [Alphaproteobacteria bacterium]